MPPSQNKYSSKNISLLLQEIRKCSICKDLPLGPGPIVQAHSAARILLVGQAPGQRTHHKGIPFDDPSGNRLRNWLGVDKETFYDPQKFAVVPMGFCYPGKGKSGDLPPRPECAVAWRKQLLGHLGNIKLTIIIGKYALDWHLPDRQAKTLTETVALWQSYLPDNLPLPHPSPRNIRWFKQNDWFEDKVIPALQERVADVLAD